jgi:4-amino-4-deoxy-L-arabinose transferase-like glycosyltransferase
MRIKEILAVGIIVIFGVVLRTVSFQVPPSLNWDEVSHAVNARFIYESRMDEWGNTTPLVFRAFGDYKLPGYIYTLSVFFAFFGQSDFVVRLPSIFFGSIMVLTSYLFVKSLQKKYLKLPQHIVFPLTASLLVAISPWTFFASRAAFEANVATSLFLLGGYFFLEGRGKLEKFGILFWLLSSLTYNSFRVIVPIVLVAYILFTLRSKTWIKKDVKNLLLASLVIFINFLMFSTSQGNARLANISVIDQGLIARVEEYRNIYQLPPLVERVVFNRYVFALPLVLASYLSAFDPRFLFLTGGDQRQFSVPGYGLLAPSLFIPLVIGLIYCLRKVSYSWSKILLFLFSVFPVAASVTRDAPHVLRLLPMSLLWIFVASLGVTILYKKSKPIFLIILVLFVFNSFSYFNNYFNSYPKQYSASWQYGSRQMAEFVSDKQSEYDKVLITKEYGEPHIFVLWYGRYSSSEYLSDPDLVRFNQTGWWWTDAFSNYVFINSWQIPKDNSLFISESGLTVDCNLQSCLLLKSPGEVLPG